MSALEQASARLMAAAKVLAVAQIVGGAVTEAEADLRRAALEYARAAREPFRIVDREARDLIPLEGA